MKPISFMGNIGCGKSTWATKLSTKGYHIVFEDLNAIKYLEKYWKSGVYSFHTQIEFYATWLDLYYSAIQENGVSIIDSSIISHHMVFSCYMKKNKLITEEEFFVCCQLYSAISKLVDCNTVYLFCNIDELHRRTTVRNRTLEPHQREFLIEINCMFENIVEKLRIPTIDISNLSPSNDKDCITFENKLKEYGVI